MASKNLVKRSYRNLETYILYKKQISGHNSNYLHMVPETSLERLQGASVLLSLRKIEDSLLVDQYSRHVIMAHLNIILSALRNSEQNIESISNILHTYEGLKILFSLLCIRDLGTKCCDLTSCNLNYTIWDLKSSALSIVHKLLTLDAFIAEDICENRDFLHVLFSLMGNVFTCSRAATLIEHLFIYRKGTFDLTTVPGLHRLIADFRGYNLANFSSILCFTISDSVLYDNQPFLYHQKETKDGSRQVIAINRSFVLGIPGFLSGLVDYATRLPYRPRYGGVSDENHQWLRLVDTLSGALSRRWSTSSNVLEGSLVLSHELALKGIVEPMLNRQETISALGLLLYGGLRDKVRTQLADLKLIPRLSKLFDYFIWGCASYQERLIVPGHHKSCGCSPESTLKIQFLRLLHDFCDQSRYKYLMLTPTEYQEVCDLNSRSGAPLHHNEFPPELMCSGHQGLISKIIETLKRENTGSPFRFWLSRVIESYLRSSTQTGDQKFMLKRGLLEHLSDSILEIDPGLHGKGILQSSFDLLGELLKFNIDAFYRLDLWLGNSKRDKFFSLMQCNMVDSSMLVRSLVLSFARFTSEGNHLIYTYMSPSFRTINTFPRRLRFLVKLIETGKVTTLTQENVNCLNTAVVILIVEHHRLALPQYLSILRNFANGILLSHLRSLLLFWQMRYSHDGGCDSLQRSTGISSDFWRTTVATLVAEDMSDPECIFHYLHAGNLVFNWHGHP